MLRIATLCLTGLTVGFSTLYAQELRLDWRRIGNSAIQHPLGDVATGPIDRVWFTPDGQVSVRTRSGITWRSDGERWREDSSSPPPANEREQGSRSYRLQGDDAFRSDDGGASWLNLTRFRGGSLLGGSLSDLAVSSQNPDVIAAANDFGVWRSMDAGGTWAGFNEGLPNLSISRIMAAPQGISGLRAIAGSTILEWQPGQRAAWSPVGTASPNQLAAIERRGAFVYRGADDSIQVTRDGVALPATPASAPVTRFWVDTRDGAIALALAGGRLLRTINGGLGWDDITGSLPKGNLRGVTADRLTGSIYLAGDAGVFYGTLDFNVLGAPPVWRKLGPLPRSQGNDVFLDGAANQLYIAVEGYGVFATLAPHRRRVPALVSAADLNARSASPGALFSLLGVGVSSARSGDRVIPLLASNEGESQLQVPFDAQGNELALRLESGTSGWDMKLALDTAAPAIFIDRDGTPMLLDGNSGVLLDAMNPARGNGRLQILATGLGRVKPEWPTGLEAPLEDPPQVVAEVNVFLDGQRLETVRSTLAAGYVGFYLVEALVPTLVNSGTAELRLEVAGRSSNSVRVYIEP